MQCSIFQLDAFATAVFRGNPAAVIVMESFPSDDVLRSLAAEINLSETAFLVRSGAEFRLRWFTPMVEVPLCGHATLASAAVVMERLEPARPEATFHTLSGPLRVVRSGSAYSMDFPRRDSEPLSDVRLLENALGTPVELAFTHPQSCMAILKDEEMVRRFKPDFQAIAKLEVGGVIITALASKEADFVSRYFAPRKGVNEDPVTGSAHTMLAPYWGRRLNKSELVGLQLSARGGLVRCQLKAERVLLEGQCVFFSEGLVTF